jgi:Tfp pilus assembly protein PilF
MNIPSCIKKRGLLFLLVLLLGAIAGSVATNYMRSTVRRGMPFFLVGKGAESYDNGDTLEALFLITKAALLDPDWYAPYLQLGQVYQKEGCSGLALLHYREAKRLMETLGTEENPGIDHDRSLIDRSIEAILNEIEGGE